MRRLLFFAIFLPVHVPQPGWAQQSSYMWCQVSGSNVAQPCNAANPLQVSGSFSATVTFPTIGAAVPATGVYDAINVAGTLRGWTGVNPSGSVFAAQIDLASVGGTSFALGQTTMAASVPVVLPSNQTVSDPCMFAAKTNLAIAMTGTTTVKLIALASSQKIYVCSLSLIASAATVVSLADGTKVSTECDTAAEAVIGAATATHGLSLAANGGLTLGSGGSTVALTNTASHDLCLFQSGSGDISGNLTYVQRVP